MLVVRSAYAVIHPNDRPPKSSYALDRLCIHMKTVRFVIKGLHMETVRFVVKGIHTHFSLCSHIGRTDI